MDSAFFELHLIYIYNAARRATSSLEKLEDEAGNIG